jgi:lipoprotein-anchoring transpeptidase ErfK/SrfK
MTSSAGSPSKHTLWRIAGPLVALLAVAALSWGLYLAVSSRAEGGGVSQPRVPYADLPKPTRDPSTPKVDRWTVAKAVRDVVAHTRPSASSPVRAKLAKTTSYGYPSVFLVDRTKVVGDTVWYRVWLPVKPNMSRGWIAEGPLAIYATTAMIEIDLSERRLTVVKNNRTLGTFKVAVGTAQLPTPTGHYYVTQKLDPGYSSGAYGVLALAISAFQPKLPNWPDGGPVAIHGTNQPELVGQAVSHGCVRMKNADITKVGAWVPTGSPVIIHK